MSTRRAKGKSIRFAGSEIKITRPIFKTLMLMYQSKANLGVKILFGKITLSFRARN